MKKRKLIGNLLLIVFAFALSVTFYSCYPYSSTSPSEYDVVITLHDDLSYFTGSFKKYAMRDSVDQISDGTGSNSISRDYDNLIRTTVQNDLTNLGYTRVTDTASADVIITLAVSKSSSLYVNNYYPGGYWYWGYGGFYYPWSTAYTVTTGTVMVSMFDKKRIQPGSGKVTGIWLGIVNGVLDGTRTDVGTRISTGIDKCFSQSPYLKAVN